MPSAAKAGAAKTGVTTYTTPNDRDIVSVRVVDAPRRIAFDAWTNPTHVSKWLLGPEGWTMPVCEVDLRAGGAWRYVWRKSDGQEMAMSGTYKEVSPPNRVVWTETWGPEWPESVNTAVFTESGGQTTITLTMTYASKDVGDAALKTGMTGGMDTSFDRLDNLLKTLV
jgi:uncharacterized protein YndB with AHSA1/START domain